MNSEGNKIIIPLHNLISSIFPNYKDGQQTIIGIAAPETIIGIRCFIRPYTCYTSQNNIYVHLYLKIMVVIRPIPRSYYLRP